MPIRTRLLPLALVLGVALTACGGGDDTAPRDERTSTTTTTSPADAPSTTAPPDPGAGTGSSTGPAAAATAATSSTTVSRGAGSTGAPAAASAPKPAVSGTYTYDVTGSARTAVGAMPIPPQTNLVVDAPNGSEQRSTRKSEQGSTEQVLRYGADGVKLVSQRAAAPQGSVEFRPAAPVVAYPAPTAGRQWSWEMTSTDGKVKVRATFTAVRPEALTVGGVAVDTWVVQGHITTTGDISSTIDTTTWWSPRHSIAVREDASGRGTYSGVSFQSETSERLRSLQPS